MTIQILGKGEKRAVVYPLLMMMNRLGGGLFITDDGGYRRMNADDDGFMGNIRVFVGAKTSHAALKSEGIYTYGYDTIVLDTDMHHTEADAVIRVARADDADEPAEGEYKICADFIRSTDKAPYIPITLPLLRELRDIECSGRFGTFKNSAAIKVLCPLLGDVFGISGNAVRNLLKKEGGLDENQRLPQSPGGQRGVGAEPLPLRPGVQIQGVHRRILPGR